MPSLKLLVPDALKSRVKIARAEAFRAVGSDRFSYPALNGMDRRVIELLPASGTFLEIGANDGYSQSNTYYLEKVKGWRGILIEPLPSQCNLTRRHRRGSVIYNAACVGPDGPPVLTMVDRNLMTVGVGLMDAAEEARRIGGGAREVSVLTAQISDLIDHSGLADITFMSLDVEGAELHVLAGMDLDRHCPDFMLVETANVDAVADELGGHMKLLEQLSQHDYLFAKLGQSEE